MTTLFDYLPTSLPTEHASKHAREFAPAAWPFDGLPPQSYRVILSDPPWRFALYSTKGERKSPQAHYSCMDLRQIQGLPVGELAHPAGAVCIMWATAPMLPQAITTLGAWGFTYKSAGAWAKQSSTGRSLAFGPGYIYRSAAEFWLIGTIGKPVQLSRSIRNLILAPRREHSRKPDQMRSDLEIMFDGPRCELFARETAPGWSAWGNQTDKFSAKGDDDGEP
jgi:N6-adenosine-specific RNA methylase IME4